MGAINHGVTAGCLSVALVAALAESQAPARLLSASVDGAVLTAADSDAAQFGAALAVAKVPAGFVLSPDDPGPVAPSVRFPSHAPPVSLDKVIERFLATHPGYELARSDWAIVVRPRSKDACVSATDSVVASASIADSAHVAFWKLARLVNPLETPTGPPGVVCGGNCDESERSRDGLPVSVTLNDTTLGDALSQLVAQAPGLVWVLRQERRDVPGSGVSEDVCRFSYFDGRNHVQTSYIFWPRTTRALWQPRARSR
jgi:hypothetical protein